MPAQNIVAIDVMLVSRKMPRSEIVRAMGDEWDDLSAAETRQLLSSEYSYLAIQERIDIWEQCPE